MPATIPEIAELQALDSRRSLIRIPQEIDVPITPRVRQIIDAPDFRRLSRISQLGLVSLVYPAAHHTRFEHSIGTLHLTQRIIDVGIDQSQIDVIIWGALAMIGVALFWFIGAMNAGEERTLEVPKSSSMVCWTWGLSSAMRAVRSLRLSSFMGKRTPPGRTSPLPKRLPHSSKLMLRKSPRIRPQ